MFWMSFYFLCFLHRPAKGLTILRADPLQRQGNSGHIRLDLDLFLPVTRIVLIGAPFQRTGSNHKAFKSLAFACKVYIMLNSLLIRNSIVEICIRWSLVGRHFNVSLPTFEKNGYGGGGRIRTHARFPALRFSGPPPSANLGTPPYGGPGRTRTFDVSDVTGLQPAGFAAYHTDPFCLQGRDLNPHSAAKNAVALPGGLPCNRKPRKSGLIW